MTLKSLLIEIPFGFRGKVYRSPMPFSAYDQDGKVWPEFLEKRIDVVVVLTESQEYLVHSRRDLAECYRMQGLDVIHFPIKDYQIPDDITALEHTIKQVKRRASQGENIAVHCMAGLGRTGTFLACMAKNHFNYDSQEAIDWIRHVIPGALENEDQENFVRDFRYS